MILGRRKRMLKVDLIDYRINRLDMVNNLGMDVSGTVGIVETSDFYIDYKGDIAVTTLTGYLEMEDCGNQFHIDLKVEGYFFIKGITSNKIKKEAHVKCYDILFPYADQIVRMLSVSCGILGLRMSKKPMEPEDVHIGEKPKSVRDEKVIDFQPDKDR